MNRFKKILYVADPATPNPASLKRAIALAESNQAELTVADIVPEISAGIGLPPGGPISQDLQRTLCKDHQTRLEGMLAPYRANLNIRTKILTGTIFLEIIRAVLRDGYDLVMKPAEDPTWLERIFGTDDMHLLRKCPCPVWLHKPEERAKYKSVLAAVDLPETESGQPELYQNILTLASTLTRADRAQLHIVHAWQSAELNLLFRWAENPNNVTQELIEKERERHEDAFIKFRAFMEQLVDEKTSGQVVPKFHLLTGSPAEVIPAKANELSADLVVMGTVNRTGIAGLFIGNTAEAILEQLRCSVLAVKPMNFETPVKLS